MNERELLPCPFCGGKAEHESCMGPDLVRCVNHRRPHCPASFGGVSAETWNTRAAPPATTAGAVDEIVREIDGIFHRWQTEAAPGTCMSDLHHAWNRLRAALSSRTAGVTVEEMQRAYHGARNARGEWNSDVAMEAVHALVAQRGVR